MIKYRGKYDESEQCSQLLVDIITRVIENVEAINEI